MLRPGDLISHFEGTTVDGGQMHYAQVWQHRTVRAQGRLRRFRPPDVRPAKRHKQRMHRPLGIRKSTSGIGRSHPSTSKPIQRTAC